MTDIGLKETVHGGNLAHRVPKKQLVAFHLWQKQQKTAKNSIAFRLGRGQILPLQSRGVA